MDVNVALEALKRQYVEAFKLLQQIVEKTPTEFWNMPGMDYFIPSRQAYHAIQALDYYTEPNQNGFNWNKFDINWEKTPGEQLLDKVRFSQYSGDVATKLYALIGLCCTAHEKIQPDEGWQPWYPTVFDRLIYGLRHFNHHLGIMSCELRKKGILLKDPCW